MNCYPSFGASMTAHLSDNFFRQVATMADEFKAKGAKVNAADWLAVMLVESGVRSSIPNAAGSKCYGLNQICNLKGVGWTGTAAEFMALTPEAQFPYSRRFWEGVIVGRHAMLNSLGRLYLLNFSPAFLGRPDSGVLYTKGKDGDNYALNVGLDFGKKGYIEVADMEKFVKNGVANNQAYFAELTSRLQSVGWTPEPLTTHLAGGTTGLVFLGVTGLIWGFAYAKWKRRL